MESRGKNQGGRKLRVVTLKAVAEHVGLTPGTVSAVLNNSAAARSVPERTKKRVLAAARELNYRPNYLARSLRVQRTYTIGVITRDLGDAYAAMIISGIERYLRQHSFFFLTVAHHNDKKLLDSYSHILLQRGVEGLISVDTLLGESMSLPTIAIAGHRPVDGVTNILLDHRRAVLLALQHLRELGHREIAFMKGPQYSSDSNDRWQAIVEVAQRSRHRGAAGAHDSLGRRLVNAGGRLPRNQSVSLQPENALYGAFCFQRQFRVGRHQRLPGSGNAGPERRIGRRVRRH